MSVAGAPLHVALVVALAGSPDAPPANLAISEIAALEIHRTLGEGELFAHLAHPDTLVRRRAALALGRIQDRAATPHLCRALEDRDAEVAREAAFALGQIGDASAREALEACARGADAEGRALAAEALGRIGAKAALVGLLHDADARVRGEAALAIWRAKATDASAALAEAVGDPDPGVRWRAAYALMQLEAEPAALRRAAGDSDALARGFACRGLGKKPDPESEPVLAARLADPEWTVAVEAAKSLARFDGLGESTARALERAMSGSTGSFHVRREAALAAGALLGKRDDPALRARLRDLAASDPSRAVRAEATHARVRCEPDEIARKLCEPSSVPADAWARARLADALAERKPEWGVPVLVRLARDADLQVREQALTALGGYPTSADARAALVSAAGLRDLGIRGSAIEALGAWKLPDLVPSFERWSADSPGSDLAEVRAIALEALSKIEGEKGAGRLEAALSDPDVIVRARAVTLLKAATGDDYRIVPVVRGKTGDLRGPPTVAGRPFVRFETEKGAFTMETFAEDAPVRVARLVADVERRFFDGLTIHRVVSNFVVQGGDPRGDGWGGGTGVTEEIGRRRFERGSVGTPTSGKDTGGSQFFVTHGPTPHLDGRYTIFAKVIEGMDVVDRLEPKDRITRAVIVRGTTR